MKDAGLLLPRMMNVFLLSFLLHQIMCIVSVGYNMLILVALGCIRLQLVASDYV